MSLAKVGPMSSERLSDLLNSVTRGVVVVDCRSGIEFSTWHIIGAVNIGGSRTTRRDILNGRVSVLSVLHDEVRDSFKKDDLVVVYDQCSLDSGSLQSLAGRVAEELCSYFKTVYFLKGGFIGFQSKFPTLCWTNKHKMTDEDFVAPSQSVTTSQCNHDSGYLSLTRSQTMTTLTLGSPSLASGISKIQTSMSRAPSLFSSHSLSGPALPPSKEGPTTLLPYLLLGTQQDALSHSCMLRHHITHVVNVSTDGMMSPFISPHNFLRIPVLDNFTDKITPYFPQAFKFLDDVKLIGGRALIHCSAGISRSPTLAIGYLMKTMNLSVTEAYNIVKASRISVSPNFNFMGQLTDYESLLRVMAEEKVLSLSSSSQPVVSRQRRRPSRLGFLSALLKTRISTSPSNEGGLKTPKISTPLLPSPSVPFARLGINSPMDESPGIRLENFPATSLDQLHFQPCQAGPRGVKTKRSATQGDCDSSSNIIKRLSMMESVRTSVDKEGSGKKEKNMYGGGCTETHHVEASVVLRRHSSVLPLTCTEPSLMLGSTTTTTTTLVADSSSSSTGFLRGDCPQEKGSFSGRSVSYERINSGLESSLWNASSIITVDSCRLQECHQSTSSLSSANSHSSNLLV